MGIQEDTHKFQGGGRGKGLTRGNRDIKLCEQTKYVTESCEAVRPWRLSNKKEVIQDVDYIWNCQFRLNNPFNHAGELVKKVGGTPQAEGEDSVKVVEAIPFHAQEFPVRWMDWDVAKGRLDVQLRHKTPLTETLNYGDGIIYSYIMQ